MKTDIDTMISSYNAQGSSEVITIPDYLFKEAKPAWGSYHLQLSVEHNQEGLQANNLIVRYNDNDKANPIMLTLNIPVTVHQTTAGIWLERELDKSDKLIIGESKKGDFKKLFIADRLIIGGDIIEQSQVVKHQPITSYKVYLLGSNSKQSCYVLETLGGIDAILKKLVSINKI